VLPAEGSSGSRALVPATFRAGSNPDYRLEAMRPTALLMTVLIAPAGWAHIKLDSPPSWQVTDAAGNPQKVGPCGGRGTPSDAGITVTAGSPLTVQWHETLYHPGHFRLSIAADQADLVTPTPVVTNNDCTSAPIEASPVLPTIADGLFAGHLSTDTVHSRTITVPMMSCERCTLQLMQFMSSHAPPCFYFQCANLRIVMPDAGPPDAGSPDAGSPDAGSPDAGSPDAGASDAGTTDAGTADAGLASDAGPVDPDDAGSGPSGPVATGGCGCNSLTSDAAWLGLVLLGRLRRRAVGRGPQRPGLE
jgi:hypothetical protein